MSKDITAINLKTGAWPKYQKILENINVLILWNTSIILLSFLFLFFGGAAISASPYEDFVI